MKQHRVSSIFILYHNYVVILKVKKVKKEAWYLVRIQGFF